MSATPDSGQFDSGMEGNLPADLPPLAGAASLDESLSEDGSDKAAARMKRQRMMGPGGDARTGNARTTVMTQNSHINMFNSIMKEKCTFDQIAEKDYADEGETLQEILTEFADALVHSGISKKQDENGNEIGEPYSADYLCKVWSTVRNELFKKYPHTQAAKSLNDMTYITGCQKVLNQLFQRRNQFGSQEDGLITKTLPIFRETDPRRKVYLTYNMNAGAAAGDGEMKEVGVDLASMCEALMRSDKNNKVQNVHKKKLALSLSWMLVSRADEPAALSYDKMYWEPHFDTMVVKLFQIKQLTCVPSTFGPDYNTPELNCLSNFAHYGMLENGFARREHVFDVPGSADYRAAMKVFQHESSCKGGAFSKLILNTMREVLPPELQDIGKKISGKSLRYGGATHLHADRLITFDEALARGGWGSGTSRDYYIFVQLAAVIPPMLSLAGFPDPTIDPVSPSLKPIVDNMSLPEAHPMSVRSSLKVTWDDMLKYIDKLYSTNMPDFKHPNGRLRPFLLAMTASCIMDFKQIYEKYGGMGCRVVVVMSNRLVQAHLAATSLKASEILKDWSEAIRADFDQRVASSNSGSQNLERVSQELQKKNHQKLVGLGSEVQHLATKLDTISLRQVALEATVQDLANMQMNMQTTVNAQLANLQTTVGSIQASLNALTQALLSNQGANSSVINVPRLTLSPNRATDDEITDDVLGTGVLQTGVGVGVASLPRRNAFEVMVPSASAAQGVSAKKKGIGEYFAELYKNDDTVFKNLDATDLARYVNFSVSSADRSKIQNAMLLVEALLTYTDRQGLISGDLTSHAVLAKFLELNEWIERACAAFDGVPHTNRRDHYFLGVGNTVGKNKTFVQGFIPDWNSIKSDPALAPGKKQTLQQWIVTKEEEIKSRKK